MHVRTISLALAFLAGTAAVAHAQAPQWSSCAALETYDGYAGDVCQKSEDIFRYMAPQLGTAMAGGNATLGQGGSLGGLGRFALGLRGNAVQGSLPQVEEVEASDGRTATHFQTEEQHLPFPAVDLAVGIFPGISLGVVRVLGVDGLVNAYYATDYDRDDMSLTVSGSKLKLGYGARVGVVEEGRLHPGVSVTYFRRDLPTLNLAASVEGASGVGTPDTLGISDFAMKTTAWRVVAGKRLGILGVAVGAGRDEYDASALVNGRHGDTRVADVAPFASAMTRTNYFADLMLNLKLFRVVGEVGQVSGGEVSTFNTFAGTQADDSRLYGSVGLRFGR